MAIEIRTLLEAHKDAVRQAGAGLLARNNETITKSLFGIALGVATSSPTLGALTSDVVAKLFANTATKRLQKAIDEADGDEERQAFIQDLAAPIEALFGEFLIQLIRVQHNLKDEIVAKLGGGPELADFRKNVASELVRIALHIDELSVSDGGVGIEISATGRTAFVRKMFVRGPKSVGLKL